VLTLWAMGQSSRSVAAYAALLGGHMPRSEAVRLDAAIMAFWTAGTATSYLN
jgi:hypothetical protein